MKKVESKKNPNEMQRPLPKSPFSQNSASGISKNEKKKKLKMKMKMKKKKRQKLYLKCKLKKLMIKKK